MRRAAAVVLGLALAACATDAPDTPSPYPPTVKPSPSTLVFGNTDTCETLRALFDRREGNEANLAKQAAVLDYERVFAAVIMLGVNLLALNRTTEALAEVRGDMLAIRGEMAARGCEPVPEVVFSTPSARTQGGSYFN